MHRNENDNKKAPREGAERRGQTKKSTREGAEADEGADDFDSDIAKYQVSLGFGGGPIRPGS